MRSAQKRAVVFAVFFGAFAQQPSIKPTPDEIGQIDSRVKEIDRILAHVKADRDLTADVEVYSKAGKMLLEFPEDFFTQDGINHAIAVLDTGVERAKQLQSGEAKCTSGTKR